MRNISCWILLPLFSAFLRPGTDIGSISEKPGYVINLDGQWQVAEGSAETIPEKFDHLVPVPGLIDMAKPAFEEVGMKSARREVFWYRKVFKLPGAVTDFAVLKIHKAKYGIYLYVNGQFVAEHWPCFTPGYFDIKKYLRDNGRENEILIAVGADRESIPAGRPSGWDFEKYRYLPGIYDHVELILSPSPRIVNVQIVPRIESGTVQVITEIEAAENAWQGRLAFSVKEKASGKNVAADTSALIQLEKNQKQTISRSIALEPCQLWSPDDPFLYELEVDSRGDRSKIPFGMRSFRFDRKSGRALLNGKPYMMRGTNVCIYRFFEDSLRDDKPWRLKWVQRLHKKFKSMHWNSIRYCIGFPPEDWYRVADSVGFLIQDEFPVWLLDRAPENPLSPYLIEEYSAWMRERWNHPAVVIWDAQNESRTPETGKAIQAVRQLDVSNRPWENGWEGPQSPDDVMESHPYLFIKGFQTAKDFFHFRDIATVSAIPPLHLSEKRYKVPVLINEYAWLWLNRDGSPTTLTKNWYQNYFPGCSTAEERFDLYARYLAALTEFWRMSRHYAGVLHFCGLGYARSGLLPRPQGGATSDHFIDLENLVFEPHFEKYVRDAFSPVAVMVDFWEEKIKAGQEKTFDVAMINDQPYDWQGDLSVFIETAGKKSQVQKVPCYVNAMGKTVLPFTVTFPDRRGLVILMAEIEANSAKIRSIRQIQLEKSD
jgi:beta-galactosidase